MSTPLPATSHTTLKTQGYAILPSHIPSATLTRLLPILRSLAHTVRTGGWPHIRTLPKQFPPWSSSAADGVWGVQHLLHPDLPVTGTQRDELAGVYFGEGVLGVVRGVLGEGQDGYGDGEGGEVSDDMLVMELFNLLITPDWDFALRWHRDDVSFELGLDEEAAALGLEIESESEREREIRASNGDGNEWVLEHEGDGQSNGEKHGHGPRYDHEHSHSQQRTTTKRRPFHTQYNIPLLPDSSLHIIPGSHLRARTPHEAALLTADPYTTDLPGWIQVKLQPGDIVFYDNNLIHRGVYSAGVERLTLHGSVGDVRAGGKRARNVLQHGWDWVPRCDFGGIADERVRRRAEGMRDRLVKLGSGQIGDVGFAHCD